MDNKLIDNNYNIDSLFDNIKDMVINSRNRVYTAVNTEMLDYYNGILEDLHTFDYDKLSKKEQKLQKKEEKRERVQQFGYSETCKWIYKDPKGFQVDLYERVFIDAQGRRFSSLKKLNASNMMLATALVAAGKKPSKCFYITAIQPESARKFD